MEKETLKYWLQDATYISLDGISPDGESLVLTVEHGEHCISLFIPLNTQVEHNYLGIKVKGGFTR